jgi:hypothetical protein
MPDIFSATLGLSAQLQPRIDTPTPAPAIRAPESAASTGGARNDNLSGREGGTQQQARLWFTRGSEPITGPPPAFQASLLEVETDLQTVIRRVAEARAGFALAPPAAGDAPQGDGPPGPRG